MVSQDLYYVRYTCLIKGARWSVNTISLSIFFLVAETMAYALITMALLFMLYLINRSLHRPRLPPGPRRMPVIGNLLNMPKEDAWMRWSSHKDRYGLDLFNTLRLRTDFFRAGPISSLTILGQHYIILNNLQVSIDLLEKRSPVYSGRPLLTFAGEMWASTNLSDLVIHINNCTGWGGTNN